ncbi:MarR family transcriptional regulator [Olsenella sp. An293]|nr:MarR family transcriptional regulator [Olsenella sp. An293]
MALKGREGSSLKGVRKRINGRHAFVHERMLEMIVRETILRGQVSFAKADLARRLGCCPKTVDHAVTRLRREGLIETSPVFGPTGAQLPSEYRATAEGVARVALFSEERPA